MSRHVTLCRSSLASHPRPATELRTDVHKRHLPRKPLPARQNGLGHGHKHGVRRIFDEQRGPRLDALAACTPTSGMELLVSDLHPRGTRCV